MNAYAGWGGYGSSKAALEHLSRILAQELDETGMRVWCWIRATWIRKCTAMRSPAKISRACQTRDVAPVFIDLVERAQREQGERNFTRLEVKQRRRRLICRRTRSTPSARSARLARDAVSLLVSDRSANATLAAFATRAYLRAGDSWWSTIRRRFPLRSTRAAQTIPITYIFRHVSPSVVDRRTARCAADRVGEQLRRPGAHRSNFSHRSIAAHASVARSARRTANRRQVSRNACAPHLVRLSRGPYPIATYQTISRANRDRSKCRPRRAHSASRHRVSIRHNVNIASITLHCGVASPEANEHPLDERFASSGMDGRCRERDSGAGGRVIAVGTTVVRALDSRAETTGTSAGSRLDLAHRRYRASAPRDRRLTDRAPRTARFASAHAGSARECRLHRKRPTIRP